MSRFRDNDEKMRSLDMSAFNDDSYFIKVFCEQIKVTYCNVKGEIIQERNDLAPEESNNAFIHTSYAFMSKILARKIIFFKSHYESFPEIQRIGFLLRICLPIW